MEQRSSAGPPGAGSGSRPEETTVLPPEVVQCLENARFLHLATCTNNQPHVSLMNYTYLPSSQYSSTPVIVMTATPGSKKFENLVANPNVSLLVHDWVSHRPPTTSRRPSGGSPGPEYRSPLASLLLNLNTSSISSISATINGIARIIPPGAPEEAFFRGKHVENNTFDETATDGGPHFRRDDGARETEAGRCFVEDEEVKVIVVDIEEVRTSDWKGVVNDFSIKTQGGVINGVM